MAITSKEEMIAMRVRDILQELMGDDYVTQVTERQMLCRRDPLVVSIEKLEMEIGTKVFKRKKQDSVKNLIKMFYYNKDDFLNQVVSRNIISYSERDFDRLMNWQYDADGNSIKPFRDECSIKFLRDTWGMEFVSDDDWYSVRSPEEGRFSLAGLSREMKYGLVLLHFSRLGYPLSFKSCSERIWQVLNTMPFDILVAVDTSRISSWRDTFIGVDYVVENFPFNNKLLQVSVFMDIRRDYERIDGDGISLYRNGGRYYVSALDLDNYLGKYFWKKHIGEILQAMNRYMVDEHPVLSKEKTFTFRGFYEAMGLDFEDYVSSQLDFYGYKNSLAEEVLPEEYEVDFNSPHFDIYDDYVKPLRRHGVRVLSQENLDAYIRDHKEQYEEDTARYNYLNRELKVITHMYTLPLRIRQRKLPVMVLDVDEDGTSSLWGTLTVKNPKFYEIVEQVVEDFLEEAHERYMLVVDVEELFTSCEDIQYTVCGFKITKDCIEIFDKNDGMKMFKKVAEKALASGKCEISKDFY